MKPFKNLPRQHQKNRLAGFSIAMVLVYMSIAAGIGYALTVFMGNVTKTYKASEVDQVVSLYSMELQRMLTHADACTRTLNPNGIFEDAAGNPALTPIASPGILTSTTDILPASGELKLPKIWNTTIPGICGPKPCAVVAGTSTFDNNQIRVKEIQATDLSAVSPAGCDPSLPTYGCAAVMIEVYFEKLNKLSLKSVVMRNFRVQVRLAPAAGGHKTMYCYATIDRDYSDQGLFVNKASDTMTGPLNITLDPAPTAGTIQSRALYVKDGYIQAKWFNQTSDRRLKKNISNIKDPFEILAGIQGRAFEWRNSNEKDYGFIAQEVEKTAPQLVITDPETQFKSMRYTSLIPITTDAVKRLRDENEELRRELKLTAAILNDMKKNLARNPGKGNK
jgi:hypothetical protein